MRMEPSEQDECLCKRDPRELLCTRSEKLAAYEPESGTHQMLNLLGPGSWASQPPELCEINFYCLEVTQSGIFTIAA